MSLQDGTDLWDYVARKRQRARQAWDDAAEAAIFGGRQTWWDIGEAAIFDVCPTYELIKLGTAKHAHSVRWIKLFGRRRKMSLRSRVSTLEGSLRKLIGSAYRDEQLRQNDTKHVACCGCKKLLHVGFDAVKRATIVLEIYACASCMEKKFNRRAKSRK